MTAIFFRFFIDDFMNNINCGIGVLHVKCKILTYFCDVISLLAQVFSSAVPPGSGDFSNADSSVVVVGGFVGVNFKGGKGQSQKRFSNFFSILA